MARVSKGRQRFVVQRLAGLAHQPRAGKPARISLFAGLEVASGEVQVGH
jgi:hypothetical protein